MSGWFQTWNRPEYIEWAKPIDNGYLLIIARKQVTDWLLARANLIFKESGFPEFQVIEQSTVAMQEDALSQLALWKST